MSNKVDFKESYIANFKSILQASTEVNSPFEKAINYLNEQYDKYNLNDETRAKNISNIMSAMAINFTTAAMQTSMDLAGRDLLFDKELEAAELRNQSMREKLPLEIESLKQQNALIKAQIEKTKADQELAKSQQAAIDRQVKDNRIIKSMSVLGEFLQNTLQGGLTVPASMNQYLFQMIGGLVKDDGLDLSAIKEFDIKQKEEKKGK